MAIESLVVVPVFCFFAGCLAGQVVLGGDFGFAGDIGGVIVAAIASAAVGAILLLLVRSLVRRA